MRGYYSPFIRCVCGIVWTIIVMLGLLAVAWIALHLPIDK